MYSSASLELFRLRLLLLLCSFGSQKLMIATAGTAFPWLKVVLLMMPSCIWALCSKPPSWETDLQYNSEALCPASSLTSSKIQIVSLQLLLHLQEQTCADHEALEKKRTTPFGWSSPCYVLFFKKAMPTGCHYWDCRFLLEFGPSSPVLKFLILEVGVVCTVPLWGARWYVLVNLSFMLNITEPFNRRSSPVQLTLFCQNNELIILAFTGAQFECCGFWPSRSSTAVNWLFC